MMIEQEIITRLEQAGVVPLLGGLVPESATATLLGYAPSYLRRLAAAGQSPLPYVLRGNRRLYRIADIGRFVTETV
ncbi:MULTISPECIES: hypothetical protein [Pseudomonas]|uniref:hypothetical protein n=1 Tax=Pseudomonas monteilii TaxID=76759 RepID=UPI0006D4692F